MKFKIIFTVLILVFPYIIYSQQDDQCFIEDLNNEYEVNAFALLKKCPKDKFIQVKFLTKNYSREQLEKFKDELSQFEEKIFNASINESKELFEFLYNDKMLIDDLVLILDKYSIKFIKSKELKKLTQ